MPEPASQHDQLLHKNTIVLANAVSLASEVILAIAGNDIASSINNTPLSQTLVNSLVLARFMNAATA